MKPRAKIIASNYFSGRRSTGAEITACSNCTWNHGL